MKRGGVKEVFHSCLPCAYKKQQFGRCVVFLGFIAELCFWKYEGYVCVQLPLNPFSLHHQHPREGYLNQQ